MIQFLLEICKEKKKLLTDAINVNASLNHSVIMAKLRQYIKSLCVLF